MTRPRPGDLSKRKKRLWRGRGWGLTKSCAEKSSGVVPYRHVVGIRRIWAGILFFEEKHARVGAKSNATTNLAISEQ